MIGHGFQIYLTERGSGLAEPQAKPVECLSLFATNSESRPKGGRFLNEIAKVSGMGYSHFRFRTVLLNSECEYVVASVVCQSDPATWATEVMDFPSESTNFY